jgi:hypothetical protein
VIAAKPNARQIQGTHGCPAANASARIRRPAEELRYRLEATMRGSEMTLDDQDTSQTFPLLSVASEEAVDCLGGEDPVGHHAGKADPGGIVTQTPGRHLQVAGGSG